MPISRPTAIKLGVVAVVIVLVSLVAATAVLSASGKVTQTETYQLHTVDNKLYFPAEAIVTVTAPRTMYVAEGFDHVDVSVDLVNHGNISGFRMQKINCYLGTPDKDRFISTATDMHLFDENGTHFETTMLLDPTESVHDARIMISLSVEVFLEDGRSYYLGGFFTPPVFGLYEVQNRFMPLMILVPTIIVGTIVASYLIKRKRSSSSP